MTSEDIKHQLNITTGFQARSKDQEREVELDPQICPEEIMSKELELG